MASVRPSSRERPPLRGDAARNAQRLIVAGRALLRENPQASAEDIARAAGVGTITLYRRFGTRDNLVRAIFLEMFETEIAPVLARAEQHADPREGVRIALEGALRTASDHGVPFSAGMSLELADSFVRPVARIVRRGQKQGVMRSDLSAENDTLRLLLMLMSVVPTFRPKSRGWNRYILLVMDSLTATPANRLPRAEPVTDPFQRGD
jgi:AcrR family transcriptional regulator